MLQFPPLGAYVDLDNLIEFIDTPHITLADFQLEVFSNLQVYISELLGYLSPGSQVTITFPANPHAGLVGTDTIKALTLMLIKHDMDTYLNERRETVGIKQALDLFLVNWVRGLGSGPTRVVFSSIKEGKYLLKLSDVNPPTTNTIEA